MGQTVRPEKIRNKKHCPRQLRGQIDSKQSTQMNISSLKISTSNALPMPLKLQFTILIFTVFYIFRWFYPGMTPEQWILQLSAFAAFLVLYFTSHRYPEWILFTAAGMVGLSIAIAPHNYGSNTFAIFAINSLAYNLSLKRASISVFSVVAITGLAPLLLYLNIVVYWVIGSVIGLATGFIGIITRQQLDHLHRERKTQAEISRLAKIAERERIGQDLHDLLGHSLTAINLKSQVCLQQLETHDLAALKKELMTIRDTAQQSIKEVRQAVTGYKTHSLAHELQSQKMFLESLGIRLDYKLPEMVLPPAIESDCLMIVREALTNCLRHAKATHCEVLCQTSEAGVQLQIQDNGKGYEGALPTTGSGVPGMKHRVEARGGQFSFSGHKGVKLNLTMPWPQTMAKTA